MASKSECIWCGAPAPEREPEPCPICMDKVDPECPFCDGTEYWQPSPTCGKCDGAKKYVKERFCAVI